MADTPKNNGVVKPRIMNAAVSAAANAVSGLLTSLFVVAVCTYPAKWAVAAFEAGDELLGVALTIFVVSMIVDGAAVVLKGAK